MNGKPRIAVDAMGGDHAPLEVVEGAILAHDEGLGTVILVGDRPRIEHLLKGRTGIEVVHAELAVPMDQAASVAVRTSAGTSLAAAIDLVRDGAADAAVSAGNSGAFLAIGLIRLRTIPGIARPAIAAVIPGKRTPSILLDAGANVDCRPEWLVQFAVMGSAYAQAVLGIPNPRVGIVTVGEERGKGNAQVFETTPLLEAAPVNFIGNVEGKDLFEDVADVFVTDGFVGNVMLKLAEGCAGFFGHSLRETLHESSPISKLGAFLARPAFETLRERLSYDSYGGAPLLGVRGNCIVAHGRANRYAVRSAIRAAALEAQADVLTKIAAAVA